MDITEGSQVEVRNALGEKFRLIATTGVVRGSDFPVVWVCDTVEWAAAQAEGRRPKAVPWPAEAVTLRNGVAP